MNKKEKKKYFESTALGAGSGAVGALGYNVVQNHVINPRPKILVNHGLHTMPDVEKHLRSAGLGDILSNHDKAYFLAALNHRKHVMVTSDSHTLDKYYKPGDKGTVYIAPDHGDAQNSIRKSTEKHNWDMGWGTRSSQNAEYVVGDKGIQAATPGQKVIEFDNILNAPKLPELTPAVPSSKKRIGLTFGTGSQAGTFFGYSSPDTFKMDRNVSGGGYIPRGYGRSTLATPKVSGDVTVFNKVVDALDKKYGVDNYELEIFTGRDNAIKSLVESTVKDRKNVANIKLTGRIPYKDFMSSIASKDLIFTNAGLNLAGFATLEKKVPTVLVDTDFEHPLTANYKENIKWFKSQQQNADSIVGSTANLDEIAGAIDRVVAAPTAGKAMVPDYEKFTNLVKEMHAEKLKGFTPSAKLSIAGLTAVGAVGGLGLAALAKRKKDKK